MKLIVGLGNYPKKYIKTRHNFGFLAVDFIAKKFEFSNFKWERKFFGQTSEGNIYKEKIILLKPETYMNMSGKSVTAVANFYKIKPSNIWVLFDDIDLNFGTIRYRAKGSSGGHNGIKSIISSLGTKEFPRIKFGINNEMRERIPIETFVLQNFNAEEWKKIPYILNEGLKRFIENCKE